MKLGIPTVVGFLLVAVSITPFLCAKPVIQPEADAVLREFGKHHDQIESAVVTLSDSIDDVQPDGRKLQFSHIRKITVQQPDKFKIEARGDVTNRTIWNDGESITILDHSENIYAEIPGPETIHDAVMILQTEFDMSIPAVDFLSPDIYETMTSNCDVIDYIGLGTVGEWSCHHLGFIGKDVDWQLWIGADTPSLRKMVITYKHLPGEPQYTLQLIDSMPTAKIDAEEFNAEIPADAEKVDIHPAPAG